MSKRELLFGTVITFMLLFFLIDLGTDVASSPYLTQTTKSSSTFEVLGWFIVVSVVFVLAFSFWFLVKTKGDSRFDRFTVRATIPGYYLLTLFPIGAGISVSVVTGAIGWIWLSCLSIPVLIVYFLLALKKVSGMTISGEELSPDEKEE